VRLGFGLGDVRLKRGSRQRGDLLPAVGLCFLNANIGE
jgi:hypothetical protein